MSDRSKIEWTDATWNPVRGCTKISPGCAHCYAETFAERFRGVPGHPYEQGFDLRLVPDKLTEPLRWSSHDDLRELDERPVPRGRARRLHRRRRRCHGEGQLAYVSGLDQAIGTDAGIAPDKAPGCGELPHIWWGVSVENRKHGLPRIEHLRQAPAQIRFLSVEPLLEDLGRIDLNGIHWVIVGGESGAEARPLHPEWVRSIRDQCLVAGVPFFFKQWGGVRKGRSGRELDGRTYDEFPQTPRYVVPDFKERTRKLRQFESESMNTLQASMGGSHNGEATIRR